MTNDGSGKKKAKSGAKAAKKSTVPARSSPRPSARQPEDQPSEAPHIERAPRGRRLPYATLIVVLAVVGVGLYVAWPAIQDRIDMPGAGAPSVIERATLPAPAAASLTAEEIGRATCRERV